jgi:hypothetical protein
MNNKYNTLAKAVRFATLAAIATPATVMAGAFRLTNKAPRPPATPTPARPRTLKMPVLYFLTRQV